MKPFILISLIALISLFVACSKSISRGTEVVLTVNEEECRNIGHTDRICFDSVISDSRCPANMMCIWQGVGVVHLTLFVENKPNTLILSTLDIPGTNKKTAIVAGYRIELMNLDPYPGLPPVRTSKKSVDVKVTRL